MPGLRLGILIALCVCALADQRDEFESKVRPILVKHCHQCHTLSKLGGLRLDSRESILQGGVSGPAAIPGKPRDSLISKAIAYTGERKMPPLGKLDPGEIETLEKWIADGLYWPPNETPPAKPAGYTITPEQRKWWAFQPVRKPAPPEVKDAAWPRTPIDRFILARLEADGLTPAPPASRRLWLRRVSLNLTGLPPAPEEIDAFLADTSPGAEEKVVDRLLASPHYGERWGRHWLDVARYSDDKLNSTQDEPYANAFRYRDWVIRAFNEDMPYNLFVKAQIAGDRMESKTPEQYEPGLGFFALSPEFQDDRVDALTRGFLGITVACAQCHDHKFDPIPTKDFYALQGVFASSKVHETPLAPKEEVDAWQERKQEVDKQQETLKRFHEQMTAQIGEMLASRTADYLLAARGLRKDDGLDAETLARWKKLLAEPRKDYPYLDRWFKAPPGEVPAEAKRLERDILDLIEQKRKVDKENEIRLGLDPSRNDLANANLVSLPRDRYAFWRDLFGPQQKDSAGFFTSPDGVYYYGPKNIERFLQGEWKAYHERQKARLDELKKALPPQYPFLHTLRDSDKPADIPIAIRGDRNNKGEIAPRAFLSVLCDSEPKRFTHGSGRLDLAEAIASPDNPLTARVFVNRVWHHHFGRGIVATPSNFGLLGEKPTHAELLDYLAARFIESGWSGKALHKEIVLSSVYRTSAERIGANQRKDPENRWLWRYPRRRMDIETIRDAMLSVSGTLDTTAGGKAEPLDEKNRRRTVYGFVSRRKLNPVLALFDFPNPNNTAEQRIPTNVAPQRLFFFNSAFVERQAKALADRAGRDIARAYRLVFGRAPDDGEIALAREFLQQSDWTQYARVLLTSNEFLYVE
jgi:hypothetical protein